jgi:putative acetyltransferase
VRLQKEGEGAMSQTIETRLFQDGDEEAFRRLNEEWIEQYFELEEKDRYTLNHPRKVILDKGGAIVFVTLDSKPVGCCALVTISVGPDGEPTEYEIAKMGVTESAKGLGLGRRVLSAAIAEGKRKGAKRLYLETNHTLAPALHLYDALGFKPVPAERLTPSPYERADVFMEMWLE